MVCSCGLWQLGGIPCVHAICAYLSVMKEPRLYVHNVFSIHTFKAVYSYYLEPIETPEAWPKSNYEDILPPDIRILPGRPKKCRKVDPRELQERAEKMAEMKEKARRVQAENDAADIVGSSGFVASRKGLRIHCKKCGRGDGHNARTCVYGPPEADDGPHAAAAPPPAPAAAAPPPARTCTRNRKSASQPTEAANSTPDAAAAPPQVQPTRKRKRRSASQPTEAANSPPPPVAAATPPAAAAPPPVAAPPPAAAPPQVQPTRKKKRRSASQPTEAAKSPTQPPPASSTQPPPPTKSNLRRSSRRK